MDRGIIPIFTKCETTYVRFEDVLYIERVRRATRIYSKERMYSVADCIDDICELLDEDFYRCHSGCVVCFRNVKGMNDGVVSFVNDDSIYLGRTNYQATRKAYINYLKELIKRSKFLKERMLVAEETSSY